MISRGSLYDLDEMVLRCHGPSAQDYIEEAVMAYKVGAYRSSIITTWIAVYFDLVDKLRVHARAGVDSAATWVETFENHVKEFDPGDPKSARSMMNMEAQILNKAADHEIGILTNLECEDLKRLREDRHRCAHPTFITEVDKFSPTAERARQHIRIAIDAVLSKSPVPGAMLVVRALSYCRAVYFPTDSSDAENELRSTFGALPPDTVAGVMEALLADLFDSATSTDTRYKRIAALDALHRLSAQASARALARFVRELAIDAEPYDWWTAIGLFNRLDWAWASLEDDQKSLFERVVQSVDTETTIGAGVVVEATRLQPLASVAAQRIGDLSIRTLVSQSDEFPEELIKAELIKRFESSPNWNSSGLLFGILGKHQEMLKDERFTTSLLKASSENDQLYTAPHFGDCFNLLLRHQLDADDQDRRHIIKSILKSMSRDHRVSPEEYESAGFSAALLANVGADDEDRR